MDWRRPCDSVVCERPPVGAPAPWTLHMPLPWSRLILPLSGWASAGRVPCAGQHGRSALGDGAAHVRRNGGRRRPTPAPTPWAPAASARAMRCATSPAATRGSVPGRAPRPPASARPAAACGGRATPARRRRRGARPCAGLNPASPTPAATATGAAAAPAAAARAAAGRAWRAGPSAPRGAASSTGAARPRTARARRRQQRRASDAGCGSWHGAAGRGGSGGGR